MSAFAGAIVLSSGVHAQNVGADAGALQRQFELTLPDLSAGQGAVTDEFSVAKPTVVMPRPITSDPSEPTLFLSVWKFSGNEVFTENELADALAGLTNQSLTIRQIYGAIQLIEAFYAEQGFVAQATLPPQEVVDGIVRIDIIEAKFAGVQFETSEPTRVRAELIRDYFEHFIPEGTTVRPAEFDLPNLLVNDLPGISVTGTFAPGRNPGETILLLSSNEDPLLFGQALADNFGSRATGRERAVIQFGLNSPLGRGDLLRFDLTKSQGADGVTGSYAFPLGQEGARVSISWGVLQYDIITPEMSSLNVAGESISRSLSLSAPLLRSRDANLFVNFSHSAVDLENAVQGAVSSDYRVRQSSFGLNGSWRDDWGGGALNSLGVSVGVGASKGSNGAGAFSEGLEVFRLNAAREQFASDQVTLFAAFSGQYAGTGLDSSEQFSLGGQNGVRAYPAGEAVGPRGVLLNLEARYKLSDQWRLTGFYDHGVIGGRDDLGEPTSYQLKGAGARVSWNGPFDWSADLTWSHRIGSNPNPITASQTTGLIGNDQDGSFDKNRFWFAIRKRF